MRSIPAKGYFVYILKDGLKVVYVGQSINYMARVGEHAKHKEFDSFDLVRVDRQERLNLIEFAYIAALTPFYNKDIPSVDACITKKQILSISKAQPDILKEFNINEPDLKIQMWSGMKEFWFLEGFDDDKETITRIMSESAVYPYKIQ